MAIIFDHLTYYCFFNTRAAWRFTFEKKKISSGLSFTFSFSLFDSLSLFFLSLSLSCMHFSWWRNWAPAWVSVSNGSGSGSSSSRFRLDGDDDEASFWMQMSLFFILCEYTHACLWRRGNTWVRVHLSVWLYYYINCNLWLSNMFWCFDQYSWKLWKLERFFLLSCEFPGLFRVEK